MVTLTQSAFNPDILRILETNPSDLNRLHIFHYDLTMLELSSIFLQEIFFFVLTIAMCFQALFSQSKLNTDSFS